MTFADQFAVSVLLAGSVEVWRDTVAANVQHDQFLKGIPARTIQEAIDAGEYDVS